MRKSLRSKSANINLIPVCATETGLAIVRFDEILSKCFVSPEILLTILVKSIACQIVMERRRQTDLFVETCSTFEVAIDVMTSVYAMVGQN